MSAALFLAVGLERRHASCRKKHDFMLYTLYVVHIYIYMHGYVHGCSRSTLVAVPGKAMPGTRLSMSLLPYLYTDNMGL